MHSYVLSCILMILTHSRAFSCIRMHFQTVSCIIMHSRAFSLRIPCTLMFFHTYMHRHAFMHSHARVLSSFVHPCIFMHSCILMCARSESVRRRRDLLNISKRSICEQKLPNEQDVRSQRARRQSRKPVCWCDRRSKLEWVCFFSVRRVSV